MSTTELFIDQDDIDWFISATLENDVLTTFGEDDRDLGISSGTTLYRAAVFQSFQGASPLLLC